MVEENWCEGFEDVYQILAFTHVFCHVKTREQQQQQQKNVFPDCLLASILCGN